VLLLLLLLLVALLGGSMALLLLLLLSAIWQAGERVWCCSWQLRHSCAVAVA
jgi:hypothetical protein